MFMEHLMNVVVVSTFNFDPKKVHRSELLTTLSIINWYSFDL